MSGITCITKACCVFINKKLVLEEVQLQQPNNAREKEHIVVLSKGSTVHILLYIFFVEITK